MFSSLFSRLCSFFNQSENIGGGGGEDIRFREQSEFSGDDDYREKKLTVKPRKEWEREREVEETAPPTLWLIPSLFIDLLSKKKIKKKKNL